nr:dsbD [Porphyrostromium boryanum]
MYNIIDSYIFIFKEYCNYILTINTVNININTFIGILVFGVLTSLNPCSISIVPIYLGYIGNSSTVSKNSASVLFFSGFVANFISIGICIIYFAKLYKQVVTNSVFSSGILLIFIGITLLRIISLPTISKNSSSEINYKTGSNLNIFVVGFSSGLVTSACNVPILVTLLAWLSSLDSSIQSLLLAITYILGYSFSIFFASILTSFLSKISIFYRIVSWCISIFGSIVLSTGVFSVCRFLKL